MLGGQHERCGMRLSRRLLRERTNLQRLQGLPFTCDQVRLALLSWQHCRHAGVHLQRRLLRGRDRLQRVHIGQCKRMCLRRRVLRIWHRVHSMQDVPCVCYQRRLMPSRQSLRHGAVHVQCWVLRVRDCVHASDTDNQPAQQYRCGASVGNLT